MQKSERKTQNEDFVRSVWTVIDPNDSHYVHRCSHCGYFKKELRAHWFFTGLYCIACIQDILWSNIRTIQEMEI